MGISAIEAALFDLDGTLLDTARYILQAYEHTFKSHRLPPTSRDEVIRLMGLGISLKECYQQFYPFQDTSRLCETHNFFQLKHLDLSLPFPNTLLTLKKLKEIGIKMAAVTARSKLTSSKTLEANSILGYFEVIVSAEDISYPKPHPESLLKAIGHLAIAPEKALMIGDTAADILAGKNAGIRTVGASYGFQGPTILESKPDFVIDDIKDLIGVFLSST